jgi:hypothetical protein
MARLVRMALIDGVEVFVEAHEMEREVQEVSARSRVENGINEALDVVEAIGKAAVKRLKGLTEAAGPDEMTIEFGVSIGAEGGFVITSGSVTGNFQASMTWKKDEKKN